MVRGCGDMSWVAAMTESSLENTRQLPWADHDSEFRNRNEQSRGHGLSLIDGGLAKGTATPRQLSLAKSAYCDATVEISPPELVRRRVIACPGLTAESVQTASRSKIEYSFHGPTHLLVAYEDGVRTGGQTCVQGLPHATLRRFARKFTFVPAGYHYYECHELRALSRLMYFYFDPFKFVVQSGARCEQIEQISSSPRVFFEDEDLWHSAMELKNLIEKPELGDEVYLQALGVVIAYRLLRFKRGEARNRSLARGGLAAWQQRIALAYIEEHISERIELATLAGLVRQSPFHFCRAFKRSFGTPPLRYQAKRRMDQAKALLAMPEMSVTEIGLSIGFGCSSSFATAFRKATGFTPTEYQRSLG
jgi:AraC family transcriptional regulator